ncbi:MAG: cobalamin biosynthesis protein [Rhodospirillales bacterium]|jgi:adenosylcobinamide-phosphate synthase|nr:cobalamin biosynthesis protein [Rhodospirillales bacterium]
MFTMGLAGARPGFDPLALLLVALAVEAIVGEARVLFRVVPHPVAGLEALIATLERKLNRHHRSPADRALRGALVSVFLIALGGVVGWGLAGLSRAHPWGSIPELVVLVVLVSQRGPFDGARAVQGFLRRDQLSPARQRVAAMMTGTAARADLADGLDTHGVARAAIEQMALGFCAGVVAPVFWYVLLGLPGIIAYVVVGALERVVGGDAAVHRAFGFTAARLARVLDLIPACLAGLFVVLAAAFVPTTSPVRAFKTMVRGGSGHRQAKAGWPLAATAGGLGLALAGPGSGVQAPWLGDGRATATERDVRRALYLYAVACLINAMWLSALVLVRLDLGG